MELLPRAMKESAFGENARLNSRFMLDAVKKNGENRAGRYSVVIALKMPPDGMRRAAFLISRRFDLSAVVRNRARRLYREIFRQVYPSLQNCWIVFIPRRPIKRKKLAPVMNEIKALLSDLGVFHETGDQS